MPGATASPDSPRYKSLGSEIKHATGLVSTEMQALPLVMEAVVLGFEVTWAPPSLMMTSLYAFWCAEVRRLARSCFHMLRYSTVDQLVRDTTAVLYAIYACILRRRYCAMPHSALIRSAPFSATAYVEAIMFCDTVSNLSLATEDV